MRTMLLATVGFLCLTGPSKADGPLRTGWYTGNSACPFVEGLAVASMPAQAKDWRAPACCEVPMTVPDNEALNLCLSWGWRQTNAGWVGPNQQASR